MLGARGESLRRTLILLTAVVFCFTASATSAQKSKGKNKKRKQAPATDNSAAPDKVLYDRALNDIKHGRQEVGRLTLQTLINTYPDSEYLAKAKLAIGDSFYKEGGTANLAQAISSYQDFNVFFPFLPEAAYAQMQIGMAHYKQLQKPDRDRTEARAAEEGFRTFLQKYPNDPLAPQAEQRLREVQELLAEGDYRVGYYYYVKGSYRAAAGRLLTIATRYPLYSRSDHALWMLGNIFEKSERKDIAAEYYARIVKDYPLSGLTGSAKRKLTAIGKPIPQPDPQALAWMQKEQSLDRGHKNVIRRPLGILQTGPDVRMAARDGKPNMEPESESLGTEILTPGGKSQLGGASAGGVVTTPVVEVVTPGVNIGTSSGTAAGGSTAGGEQPPVNPPAGTSDNAAAAPAQAGNTNSAVSGGSAEKPADAAAESASVAAPAPSAGAAVPKSDAGSGGDSTSASAQPDDPNTPKDNAQPSDDKKKESTSKKKKGLKKIIPW